MQLLLVFLDLLLRQADWLAVVGSQWRYQRCLVVLCGFRQMVVRLTTILGVKQDVGIGVEQHPLPDCLLVIGLGHVILLESGRC